jgi:hypothetical protein
MQGCWSILLGLRTEVQSRSRHLHCLQGALLLSLLLLLHGTCANHNTCGVGLNTPGGEYSAGFFQALSKLAHSGFLFAYRRAGCSGLMLAICVGFLAVVYFLGWLSYLKFTIAIFNIPSFLVFSQKA